MILKQYWRAYDTRRNQEAQENGQESLRDAGANRANDRGDRKGNETSIPGKPASEAGTQFSRAADQEKLASEVGAKFNKGTPDEYELPATHANAAPIDGAALTALRHTAAGIESPERGVTLTVTQDGRAIATGPKGVKVPDQFQRFAADNNLALVVRRSPDNVSRKPMPRAYRESGALYFGEIGNDHIDRTGKTTFSRAGEQEKAPSNVGGHEPLADQSTAKTLNNALVKYGLGEKWRNAYEAVKLPDALSGIREEIQAAFGRDIRPVAPTNSAFDQFNGIHVKGEIFVNVAGKVGFVPIAGHELWHNIMSCGLKGKGASNE